MSEIPYMMVNTRAEFERVRDLAWPVTDRTAATDAEFRSRIAPFESAPTPPEIVEARVVEEVARAIFVSDEHLRESWDDPDFDWMRDNYRANAAAAVAAVAACRAAQDGGAEEAVRDDREPKVCPRCGQTCTYDGWDHVHKSGYGIGSCSPQADR